MDYTVPVLGIIHAFRVDIQLNSYVIISRCINCYYGGWLLFIVGLQTSRGHVIWIHQSYRSIWFLLIVIVWTVLLIQKIIKPWWSMLSLRSLIRNSQSKWLVEVNIYLLIMLLYFSDVLVGVSVSHVIKMAWERLPRLQSFKLNELILKVCGRDEYLDKYI